MRSSPEHPPVVQQGKEFLARLEERTENCDRVIRTYLTQLRAIIRWGHGGTFQFHEQFVQTALAFLAQNATTQAETLTIPDRGVTRRNHS